jgi:hypothetical protein
MSAARLQIAAHPILERALQAGDELAGTHAGRPEVGERLAGRLFIDSTVRRWWPTSR